MKTSEEISAELKGLYEADQQDRAGKYGEINLESMRVNDEERIHRAHEICALFKAGNLEFISDDFFHLAMLFQHSSNIEDYAIALELSNLGVEKGSEKCKWLSAASEDRYLLTRGEKQKWGTQFRKNEFGGWEQSPMSLDEESGATDDLRKQKGVPERVKQLEMFLDRKDIKK
ncbi:MAG: hypothetical protein A2544_00575 [Candidatus Zambryskibacteria bacterium RIFOXYD2_FULL_43_10]|uniref:Uncharacterized protein n=1 Tax=Candidatus Zambryskibacteria bacterium RIFOXYD2_FULL_43_10 TaxID=1802782 RepID=A0A1G2V8W2_9BACT|nr:MAG: hypothetical protein A2544_00575 [Candidatus Zambryskibacteria bacterium RIFOXYD2_FULL_43_10]